MQEAINLCRMVYSRLVFYRLCLSSRDNWYCRKYVFLADSWKIPVVYAIDDQSLYVA